MRKFLLLIIPLIFFGFFIAGDSYADTGVWQACSAGDPSPVLSGEVNYSAGYKFIPNQNGRVTSLCGYFFGTRTVKLYNSSYNVLANASVASAGNWSCSPISNIDVASGSTYYVVADLTISGGGYAQGLTSALPRTCGDVSVSASVKQSPSGVFNAGHNEFSGNMYGLADIVFVPSYALTVSKSGSGAGMVNFNPPNTSFFLPHTETYNSGASVTLTANASPGSTFSGWSGACSGTETCILTIDGNKSVSAIFDPGCQDHDLSGYAWSENIGWISFSCKNTGAPYDYGVDINQTNGNFSGYVWSENIGWINFAPAGPYPASPNYSACLDLPGAGQVCDGIGDYKISGWARVLAYDGGWDGWIKLRGTAQDGSSYGVSIDDDTGDFSGYAWSDMVAGWIKFSGPTYKVRSGLTFNQSPDKPNTFETDWNRCAFRGGAAATLSWTYSDSDGDPQSAYEIEVDENSGFGAPKFNHKVNFPATSYVLNLHDDDEEPDDLPLSMQDYQLDWNSTYFWRVRVWDTFGAASTWSNSSQSKTDKHASPWVEFTWTPLEPTQGEIVEFDPDGIETFGGSAITSYLWTIAQGSGNFVDGTSASSQYPHIIFSTLDNKVKLEVEDSDGYSCESDEEDITVQMPLPEYKEITPIIWFRKALGGLVAFLDRF